MNNEKLTAIAKKIRTRTYEVKRFALKWWVQEVSRYPYGLSLTIRVGGPFDTRREAEACRVILVGEMAAQTDPAI